MKRPAICFVAFTVAFLSLCGSIFGAIAFVGQANFNSAATTNYSFPYTATGGSNNILIFSAVNRSTGAVITSVTYGGSSMARVTNTSVNDTNEYLEIWALMNPPAGLNNVVVNQASSRVVSGVMEYSGASGAGNAGVFYNSATQSITVTVTTSQPNSWLSGIFGQAATGMTFTHDVNITQEWNNASTSSQAVGFDRPAAAAAAYSLNYFSSGSNASVIGAVEILAQAPTPTFTIAGSPTITPTITPTWTNSPVYSPTITPTYTLTQAGTNTITPTITQTPVLDTIVWRGEWTRAGIGTASFTLDQATSGTTTISGSGKILIVSLSNASNVAAVSVTNNGVNLTLLQAVSNATLTAREEIWYQINPPDGAVSIAVNMASSTTAIGTASWYNGVNQSQPFGAFTNTISDSTTALGGTITTVYQKSWVITALCEGAASDTIPVFTKDALFTSRRVNYNGTVVCGRFLDSNAALDPGSYTYTNTLAAAKPVVVMYRELVGMNSIPPTATPTFTIAGSATNTPTISPTWTNSPNVSPTITPTWTVTSNATATSTPTVTNTACGVVLPVCAACAYTSIAGAYAAAGACDIIELREDRNEMLDIGKNIGGIRSDNGSRLISSNSNQYIIKPTGISQEVVISGLRIRNTGGGPVITFQTGNAGAMLKVVNCTIESTGGGTGIEFGTNLGATQRITADSCLFTGNGTGVNAYYVLGTVNPNTAVIKNCIINGWSAAIRQGTSTVNNVIQAYNNTIYNCGTGAPIACGSDFRNNLFINNTADLALTGSASKANFSYNAFSVQTDTGGFGAGNLFGIVPANEVVNAGAGNFNLLSGARSRDSGVTLAQVPLDIVGTTRPQIQQDIGAYEYIQQPDTAKFPFEDMTLMGFTGYATSTNINTGKYAAYGNRGVEVNVTFTAGAWSDAYLFTTNVAVSGTASAWVYVPNSAPANLQASLFLLDAGWAWKTSGFTILTPGVWTQLTWNTNSVGFVNQCNQFGLFVGANNVPYAGAYYVDSINYSDPAAPTPTLTPFATGCFQSDAFSDSSFAAFWKTADIGFPLAGSQVETTSLTINAAGQGIDGASDGFRYIWQGITGYMDIDLDITNVPSNNEYSKSGIMMRQDNAPNAMYAFVGATRDHGYVFQVRMTTGGYADFQYAGAFSNATGGRVRLVRNGNTLSGFYWNAGAWVQIGTDRIVTLNSNTLLGIAVTGTDQNLGGSTVRNFTRVYDVCNSTPTNTPTVTQTSTVTATRTPMGNILFVVNAHDGALPAQIQDQTIYNRMISDGYYVALTRAVDSVTGDAAGRNKIIISSSVASGDVNTKFTNVAVPILCWEYALFDDLNMAVTANIGFIGGQTQIYVKNPADWLADGNSMTTTVYTIPQSMSWGLPNSNAFIIAEAMGNSSEAVMWYYNKGAMMENSFTAPERRLGWFLYNTDPDSAQNAAALSMFDKALAFLDYREPTKTITPTHTISPTWTVSPTITLTWTISPTWTISQTHTVSPTITMTSTPIIPACVISDAFNDASFNVSAWQAVDIGSPLAGSQAELGSLTITASGADIWNNADSFRFIYQQVSGDMDITLKINSVPTTDGWSKAGIMFRENALPGSMNACVLASQLNNYTFQRRVAADGASANTGGGTYTNGTSGYVRLKRTGNNFTGFYSPDGIIWTEMLAGGVTINMNAVYFVGIAVTSHNAGLLGSASVNDFTVLSGFCTATPTITQTSTVSPTGTATPSFTRTNTGTKTPSPTFTSTNTPSPTFTSTNTPSPTFTSTNTPSPTFTSTNTPSPTFTSTNTPSPTFTSTNTPSPTFTSTNTPSPTFTSTNTSSPTFTSTNTPSPTFTSTNTPSPTFTSTKTPSPTFTSTNTPSPTFTGTNTPSPTFTSTKTPSPTFTSTNTPSPTFTSTNTPSPTFTGTNTPSPTFTSTKTPSPTFTSTNTPSPTFTSTNTPSPTFTSTYTPSPTFTSTNTPSPTFTSTNTPSPTFTSTKTPSPTFTSTNTPSPTFTSTNTPSPTFTGTNTASPTFTRTNTPSPTFTSTNTPSPTFTGTNTPSPTFTGTNTPSPTFTGTNTPSPTFTSTYTPSPTFTGTNTPSPTFTGTNTPSPTFTGTNTPSPTFTVTGTFSATATSTSSVSPSNTNTNTPANTATPTFTATQTSSGTATGTYTITPTFTVTASPTVPASPSNTYTGTQTSSVTNTPTFTFTISATPTYTQTRTQTSTRTNTFTATNSPTASISATFTMTPTISPTSQFTSSVSPTITRSWTITSTSTISPTITVSPTSTPAAYAHIEPTFGVSGGLVSFSYYVSAKGDGPINQLRIKIPAGVAISAPASSMPGAVVAIVSNEIRVVYVSGWNAFSNPDFDIITFDAVSAGPGTKLFESYLNAMPLATAEVPAGYSQTVNFTAPTATGTPTITLTITPTFTSTPYVSRTFTVTRTFTFTGTATQTGTQTPVYTPTISPTITVTYTGTPPTETNTSTITNTWTLTETQSETSTGTGTVTPTITVTFTGTATPTVTITNTITIKGIDMSFTDISDIYYAEGMPSAAMAVYTFTNIGGADEPVHMIRINAYDEFNSTVNGASVFGNIYAVDAAGNTLATAPYPSGSIVDIAFTSDLLVPLQQSRSVYIYGDVKPGSGPVKIKLSLDSELDVSADVPVSAAPGYGFAMRTKAVEIRKLTTVLNISGFDLMPPAVSTGQKDVYAYLVIITNPGTSQYSDSLITGITLTARNDLDSLISAGAAISKITLRDAADVFYTSVSGLASSSIYCQLQQPVTITAGSSKNIYAVIDITGNTVSHASGIKLSYETQQAFGAREYHYPAQVSVIAAAGYAYPFTSSAALILSQAAQVNAACSGTMPGTVSTGQQAVQAMSIVLANTGNTSTASVMSTLMSFYIKDSVGNVLNPALYINAIKVTSQDGSVVFGSVSSFTGGKIQVNLTAPVIISGAQPVTLSVKVDIAGAYNASPFTVVLNSASDIYAVDSNIFTPVAVTGAFPASGELSSMQAAAGSVDLLNFVPLAPASVVKGQKDVALFAFDAVNPGGAQAADAEFTGMSVYMTDALDAYISAGGALENVRVIGPSGTTLSASASPSASVIDLAFSSPIVIPQGGGKRVTVYADILPAAIVPDFKAAILSGLDVWVRDRNSKIEAAKNPVPAMPWRTNAVSVLTAPATALSIWRDSTLAPVQVGASQPDVRFMGIELYNDAFPGSATLRVSGITLTAIDSLGAPLALASVLDGIRIINLSGATVYSYANVSLSASASVYLQFTAPVDVPAANTVTVYVSADISTSPAFTAFRLRVQNAAAVAASNLPSGSIMVSAGQGDSFPMDSSLTAITSLAYTLHVGHVDAAPVSVIIGQAGVGMLRLLYTNNNSVPIGVTSVAMTIRNRSGAAINADTVISNIYLVDGTGATIASQAAPASSVITFLPPAFNVPAAGSNSMYFVVDISPACAAGFYIELAQRGDLSTSPPATAAPAPGDFFGNLKSGAPSIQPKDLNLSYHGFPNPFDPVKNNLTIEYYLRHDSMVTIKLYTIYGRFVRALAENSARTAGLHSSDFWDGKNAANYPVKSGVYLCVMEVNDSVEGNLPRMIRKVVLLR